MIGGRDIILPTGGLDRSAALDVCLKVALKHWKHAVIQSGESGVLYDGYGRVPLGKETELLIYRDRESFKSWDTVGAHPENWNTMVHLLAYTDTQLTVVVDDLQAADMWRLLRDMRKAILDTVCVMRFKEMAAA